MFFNDLRYLEAFGGGPDRGAVHLFLISARDQMDLEATQVQPEDQDMGRSSRTSGGG